jgi:hypothetical protein
LPAKSGPFCWLNVPFRAEMLAKTDGKGPLKASFSFRQTSNFIDLERIFLPGFRMQLPTCLKVGRRKHRRSPQAAKMTTVAEVS